MKAYVISEAGGPEKLVLSDVDTPKVKPGWVLIKVRAKFAFDDGSKKNPRLEYGVR